MSKKEKIKALHQESITDYHFINPLFSVVHNRTKEADSKVETASFLFGCLKRKLVKAYKIGMSLKINSVQQLLLLI